jgi:hypothetical protein
MTFGTDPKSASTKGHRTRHCRVPPACLLLVLWTAPAAAQVQYPVVVDGDMTTTSGVFTLLTIQRALGAGEDRLIPPKLFGEDTTGRRLLGTAYRLGRLVILDLPVDELVVVVNHEVFGHGARLRELGATRIRYEFDAPFPYGGGGGSASFSFSDPPPLTPAQELAIYISGIEAHNIAGRAIELRALARRRLHYREAWLYFWSLTSGLDYVLEASDTTEPSRHDVNEFLRTFNGACAEPGCEVLTSRRLQRRALIGYANPLLAYTGYRLFASYLWGGKEWLDMPSLPFGHELRYLPWFRFQLAPFGTEWISEHAVVRSGRLLSFSLRRGDAGTGASWGSGVEASPLIVHPHWLLNVSGHVWSQPPNGPSGHGDDLRLGGALSASLIVRLGEAPVLARRAGLYVQGGYKTQGFLAGEPLGAGPIFRIGLSFEGK